MGSNIGVIALALTQLDAQRPGLVVCCLLQSWPWRVI